MPSLVTEQTGCYVTLLLSAHDLDSCADRDLCAVDLDLPAADRLRLLTGVCFACCPSWRHSLQYGYRAEPPAPPHSHTVNHPQMTILLSLVHALSVDVHWEMMQLGRHGHVCSCDRRNHLQPAEIPMTSAGVYESTKCMMW